MALAIATGDRTKEEATPMPQVQPPTSPGQEAGPQGRPSPPGGAAIRPALAGAPGPLRRPLAAPDRPRPPEREVNPMSTLRRLPTRLLLVAGPAVLLVVETAGRYFP